MKREYTDEELIGRLRELISKFDDAEDTWNRSEWGKKYGDRLGQYSDKLKTLNGDDFDIINSSYDEFHSDYEDIGDDAYIEALEDNIKKVLNRVWPEATPEEIESTAEQICEEHKADEEAGEIEAKEEESGEAPIESNEVEVEVKTDDPEVAESVADEAKEAIVEEEAEEDPIDDFKKLVDREKAKYNRNK